MVEATPASQQSTLAPSRPVRHCRRRRRNRFSGEGAAFVRLQRRFVGQDLFSYIAAKLYEDEVFAFRLLGLMDERGVPK